MSANILSTSQEFNRLLPLNMYLYSQVSALLLAFSLATLQQHYRTSNAYSQISVANFLIEKIFHLQILINHHAVLIHKYVNKTGTKCHYMHTVHGSNKINITKEKGQGKYKQNLPHLNSYKQLINIYMLTMLTYMYKFHVL